MIQKIKKAILFAIFMSFTIGCEKDTQTDITVSESPNLNSQIYTGTKVSKKEMDQNLILRSRLNDLEDSKGSGIAKLVFSDDNEFFVDTDEAIYLESLDGTYHSYTFPLMRTDGSETVENLLLSLNDETLTAPTSSLIS